MPSDAKRLNYSMRQTSKGRKHRYESFYNVFSIKDFVFRLYWDQEMSGNEIAEKINSENPNDSITAKSVMRWVLQVSKASKHTPLVRSKAESFSLSIIKGRMDYAHQRKISKFKRHVLNTALRYKIMNRDNFKCVLCGHNDLLEIDHILPVCNGGGWEETNLRTLCFLCNKGKQVVECER